MTPDHVTALVVVVVSGIVILAYNWINPDKEAERHYLEHENHVAYRVMEGCYIVILTAAAYNFRFLIFDIGKELVFPFVSMALAKGASTWKGHSKHSKGQTKGHSKQIKRPSR